MRKAFTSFLLLATSLVVYTGINALAADTAQSGDPTSLYRSAFGTMDALLPLPTAAFETVVHLTGAHMLINKESDGRAEVELQLGADQSEQWRGGYDQASGQAC